MANQVVPTDLFEAKFNRLKKKYRTLKAELKSLTYILEQTPDTGESLGSGLYKIRPANKGKGKRGGFRVITYLVLQTDIEYRRVPDLYLRQIGGKHYSKRYLTQHNQGFVWGVV